MYTLLYLHCFVWLCLMFCTCFVRYICIWITFYELTCVKYWICKFEINKKYWLFLKDRRKVDTFTRNVMNLYEELNKKKVVWMNCTNESPEGVVWTSCKNELHERVARTSCMNDLHERVARTSCMNELHEWVARTSCSKNLHETKFGKKSFVKKKNKVIEKSFA